jgi:PAS domain S-box-containing protein
MLLLALLLARTLAQGIAAPLRRLSDAAAAIAGGEGSSRIPPGGSAEAAAAGQALNRMLDAFDATLDSARRREWELRAMLDSIDEAVYAQAADGGTMRYLSPAAEALYGGDVRHFAAAPRLRHADVLEEDRPRLEALAGQLQQAGRGEAEYRIRRSDGQVRWLRERCRLLYDADGMPIEQVGVVSDVTVVRALIEGLKQSEARFRSLADLSSDWYWEQDAECRFVEITGLPSVMAVSRRAAFLGKCRWEADTVGLDEAGWAAHRARLARHEAFRGLEYGIRLEGDYNIMYISISGEPVFDAAGTFSGYRGVGSDITARRRMEAALRESEARLLLVLEATSEGVWDYDVEGGDTYFSPRFAELLGYASQPELKASFSFAEALHPEDRQRELAAQERALRGGARFDEVYRLRCKDGAYRWFHGRGIGVLGGAGRPQRFVGAIADVTEQMAAGAQLRKLSAAIEQSPVAVVITDTCGDIEYVNPRFCESTGYTAEEVRGRNPRILKSGETSGEEYKRLWDTITRGDEWSGELHNRKKNGELFWEFVRIIPLVSDKGVVTNFMAVKEDITLRKELTAREQLRQEQMLHHARLAAMGEMAAALAHELNQPLAAIANFSGVVEHQLAGAQTDLAQVREVVRTIGGQALRAGEIVWRVREFSRKQESRREPADINGLVSDVVRLADIAARSREVVYAFDLAPGLPQAPVDRVQIEQVLLNLIRNGVEAMESVPVAQKRLLLASRLGEGGAVVQVTVRDHGSGLPDRIAVDLFTPFFTTKPEGMGMGLSISRGIIEAHGGRLWAAPDEEGGTAFHFTLPLQAEAA